jgi:hypothetical protein
VKGFAVSGRAGAGKSTLANHLIEELRLRGHHAERVSFGDALKAEVAARFGVVKDDPGGRELLVKYGEEMRSADPLYWVRPFAERATSLINSGVLVVCDDLRFLSELGWCHAAGLATVRLEVPARVAARRVAQVPDPTSPGEAELIPWSGWTYRYDDWDGSLRLPSVARQLALAAPPGLWTADLSLR